MKEREWRKEEEKHQEKVKEREWRKEEEECEKELSNTINKRIEGGKMITIHNNSVIIHHQIEHNGPKKESQ